jgi:hypothetical protein
MKKTKRFDEGGETVYAEDLPEDYSERMYSSTINRQAPAASKPAAKSASKSASKPSTPKASSQYDEAARNKFLEARGYDEASKNKNLSAADRRSMLTRHSTAMRDYDTLGKAGKSMSTKGMKSGGTASSRGDGVAQRGKTKGRVC